MASWLAKVISGSLLMIFFTLVSGSWLVCLVAPRPGPFTAAVATDDSSMDGEV